MGDVKRVRPRGRISSSVRIACDCAIDDTCNNKPEKYRLEIEINLIL